MKHRTPTKAKSVGTEALRRMREFCDSLADVKSAKEFPKRFTCRTVKLELVPRSFTADEVRRVRKSLRASQAVFAKFIGISTSTLQDWEQGVYAPSGAARRLLEEIGNDPGRWIARLKELSSPIAGE